MNSIQQATPTLKEPPAEPYSKEWLLYLKILHVFYFLFCSFIICFAINEILEDPTPANYFVGALFVIPSMLQIAAGVGIFFHRKWGRVLCYIESAILLLGIPVGTVIGGLSLFALDKTKGAFR